MSRLVWDQAGQKIYETGVKDCALYTMGENGTYNKGVAWNGITGITESPSGAEKTKLYANDAVYANLLSAEEYGATIEAYTYPEEFAECDGSAEIATGVTIGQQPRKAFGLVYKTTIGNDTESTEHGYKLHLVYGGTASPSEKSHATINESPEAMTLSWEVSTVPVAVTGHKPTASLEIDSTKVSAEALAKIEAKLYGDESGEPTLLLPDEIVALLAEG